MCSIRGDYARSRRPRRHKTRSEISQTTSSRSIELVCVWTVYQTLFRAQNKTERSLAMGGSLGGTIPVRHRRLECKNLSRPASRLSKECTLKVSVSILRICQSLGLGRRSRSRLDLLSPGLGLVFRPTIL